MHFVFMYKCIHIHKDTFLLLHNATLIQNLLKGKEGILLFTKDFFMTINVSSLIEFPGITIEKIP